MSFRLLGFFLLFGLFTLEYVISNTNASTRPKIVNIGAILSFNSTIGKVAKIAIQAAMNDVNASPEVLHGTKLNISMRDSVRSGFLGVVDGK